MIIILLVVVIMIAAFQTLQLVSLSAPATGAATAKATQGFSSNEEMMQAHHGGSSSGSSAGSGMVGGC